MNYQMKTYNNLEDLLYKMLEYDVNACFKRRIKIIMVQMKI